MIQFKDGVKIKDLQPQILLALRVVEEAYDKFTLPTMVTSCNDGQHMEGSLHYKGAAVDIRTKNAAGIAKGLVNGIKQTLAPLGFDVLFEDPAGDNEHMHIEYDPK